MLSRTAQRTTLISLALVAGATLTLVYLVGWHAVWAYALAINVATLTLYGYDKTAARQGRSETRNRSNWRRVPEFTLHVLALLGGAPGAWAGQQFFRHKTVKGSFRVVFLAIIILQLALLGLWLFYPQLLGLRGA